MQRQFAFRLPGKAQCIVFIFALYMAFMLYIFADAFKTDYNHYENLNADSVVPIGQITQGIEVKQELPYRSEIDGISVMFATYQRTNSGNVYVIVTGIPSGVVYLNHVLTAEHMADNSFVDFPFSEVPSGNMDEKLELLIRADSPASQAVTIWSSNYDTIPGCALTINGNPLDCAIVCRTFTVTSDIDHGLYLTLIAAILVLFLFSLFQPALAAKGSEQIAAIFKTPIVVLPFVLFFLSCVFSYLHLFMKSGVYAAPVTPLLFLLLSAWVLASFDACAEQRAALAAAVFAVLVTLLFYWIPTLCASMAAYYGSIVIISLSIPAFFLRNRHSGMRKWTTCRTIFFDVLFDVVFPVLLSALFAEFAFARLRQSSFLWSRFAFFIVCGTVLFTGIRFRSALKIAPEKCFVLLCLSFGLYLCVFSPIVAVSWDEQIHYDNVIYPTIFKLIKTNG